MSCVESQPLLKIFVYLAYLDDSESAAKKDQQKSSKTAQQTEPFQVLCAVLVEDSQFVALEVQFSIFALTGHAPPHDFPEDFEFHAMDLFHGNGFFETWHQSVRFHVFKQCMEALAKLKLPIIYGAVDKVKLSGQIYKSANPLDVCFRLCLERIQKWLALDPWRTGLLIADTFDDGKKRNLKRIFREYRKKFVVEAMQIMDKVHSSKNDPPGSPQPPRQVLTSKLLDDMYFGDSSDSVGIQASDMCAFLIRRHLEGKQDSEWLYKIIEPQVMGSVWPE